MIGDVGGVLREDIADDLIDGVVALFLQCLVHGQQDLMDLFVLIFGAVVLTLGILAGVSILSVFY